MNQIKIYWLTTSVIIAIAIGIGIYFFSKQNEAENRSNIDRWFEEKLAISLAEKLGIPYEEILQIIRGSSNPSDPIITDRIRQIVNSARLTFRRISSINNIEISLNLDYTNGTSFSVSTNRNWDELPETIRSEFIRSGSNTVSRPWYFPWDNQ